MQLSKSSAVAVLGALATMLLAGTAHAGLVGDTVNGTLAFGPDGAFGGQFWSTQTQIITDPPVTGPEYLYVDAFNADSVDFTDTQLFLIDQNLSFDANGFEMTFALTTGGAFNSLVLDSSNFDPGLTYSLNNGVITIDWVGFPSTFDPYEAVFDVTASSVPEPLTLSLFGTGVVGAVALRRRRKIA